MIGCLILHGYTGSPNEVQPLTDYLKQHTNFHIKTPTLPGHGKTLNLDNVSYENWIIAAENAYKQLKEKTDHVYIIGFSMGGMIAAYLAAKHRVEKLVLLATAGRYLSLPQIGRDVGEAIKDGLTGKIKENQLVQRYKSKIGDVPFKANLEFMRLVKFTRKHLKHVQVPVLIAQGHLDSLVPYKTAYYLEKEIQSDYKEVVFFDQSRHLICLGEDKDTLNSMVHTFLTSTQTEGEHILD